MAAIPKHWRQAIEKSEPCVSHDKDVTYLECIHKDIKNNCNKEIYEYLVKCIAEAPTAQNKWIEYYPFLETACWGDIYLIPNLVLNETKLQSFQYSIINRYINCNYNLYIWNLIDSPNCQLCNDTDTIEHHFYYCPDVKAFWDKIGQMLTTYVNFKREYTVLEVLLGIPCKKYSNLSLLNYILIIGKWYIHQSRLSENPIGFINFLFFLKVKLDIHILVEKLKDINNQKHDMFVDLCEDCLINI